MQDKYGILYLRILFRYTKNVVGDLGWNYIFLNFWQELQTIVS